MAVQTGIPSSFTNAELTNPTTTTVIADTGPVQSQGVYEVLGIINASANAQFQVQRRSKANGQTIEYYPVYVLANSSGEYRVNFFLEVGERVRIMMDDNLTGTAFATINLRREQNANPNLAV